MTAPLDAYRDLSPAALASRGIRAVLFDKDGTLLDSLGPWARAEAALCAELLRRRGFPPGPRRDAAAEALLLSIGVRAGAPLPDGLLASGTTAAIADALAAALGRAAGRPEDPQAFRAEAAGILASLFPGGGPDAVPFFGADAVLRALATAGFPLGLATSDDRARTLADLDRASWRGLFSFLACGDDGGAPKPSPRPVLDFARAAGLPASAVAVAGDSAVDRAMAEAAGAGLFVHVAPERPEK